MKEVKRVYTVEITSVSRGNMADFIPKEKAISNVEIILKEQPFAKEVNEIKVVGVQDSIRDVQTNFEKIKGMSKAELAEFLYQISESCSKCGDGDEEHECPFEECMWDVSDCAEWLKEEAKE